MLRVRRRLKGDRPSASLFRSKKVVDEQPRAARTERAQCAQRRVKEEELTHVDRRKLGSNEQGTHRAPAPPHPVTEALSQSFPNTPIPVGKESGFMFSLLSFFFLDLIFG